MPPICRDWRCFQLTTSTCHEPTNCQGILSFTRAFSFNFHSTWIQNSWGMSYIEYIYKAVIRLLWGDQKGLPLICVKATHISLLEKVKVERSVQFSRSVISDSMQPHGLQHARLPCPSPTPRICSNSCPSNRWCHSTISSSVILFSSCLQSFLESGSFPMS